MSSSDQDDIPSNPSQAVHFNEVVRRAVSRRGFLKAGLGAGAVGFMGAGLTACGGDDDDDDSSGTNPGTNPGGETPAKPVELNFKAVPISTADTVVVPEGYQFAVINRWGDPLFAGAPAFKADASNGGDDQARQLGYNHDGMHFFPIDGTDSVNGSSVEGLMVTNHEYTTPDYFYPVGVQPGNAQWNLDWVRKSQHAHGVSVRHMRLANGKWEPVLDSPFNRSVNANVAMQLVGPAAGNRLVRTNADPTGTRCFGTFGNCGNGYTLWNTYLTCEENFTDYFGVGTADPATVNYPDAEYQAHMERYKGSGKTSSSSYRWDHYDNRFNWAQEPNEYNRCGWVVEIDPFDPNSTPKKLTALGRFKHENAAMTLADDKRVVVYMGDDQVSEYIYKFVSDGKYDPARPALNRLLLDKGTLYVARFLDGAAQGDAMGVGEWIALKLDTPSAGRRHARRPVQPGHGRTAGQDAPGRRCGGRHANGPARMDHHPSDHPRSLRHADQQQLARQRRHPLSERPAASGRRRRQPPYRQPVWPDRALAREERRSGVADFRMGHLRAGGQPDAVPAHRPAQRLGQCHHGQHLQQPRRPGLRQARPAVDRD